MTRHRRGWRCLLRLWPRWFWTDMGDRWVGSIWIRVCPVCGQEKGY